jgi:hypothetical protein
MHQPSRRSKWTAAAAGCMVVLGIVAAGCGRNELSGAASKPTNTHTTTAPTTHKHHKQSSDHDAQYIAVLEKQDGLDFFAPYGRSDLIKLGHHACRDLRTIPKGKVDDAHVMPKAGAMMRAHPGMNIDEALQIYATADAVYCPDAK